VVLWRMTLSRSSASWWRIGIWVAKRCIRGSGFLGRLLDPSLDDNVILFFYILKRVFNSISCFLVSVIKSSHHSSSVHIKGDSSTRLTEHVANFCFMKLDS